MLGSDDRAIFRTRNCALNLITKLPHVSRPITHHQQIHSLRRDLYVLAAKLRRIMIDVVVDDRRNLRPALTQGWYTQANHIEPVIKVFTETTLRNHVL